MAGKTRPASVKPVPSAPQAYRANRSVDPARDADLSSDSTPPVHNKPIDLHWIAPPGWRQAPSGPLCVVSFQIGKGEETECYVSPEEVKDNILTDNINRWRHQMGLAPLSSKKIEQLEKITVLGRSSTLLEIYNNSDRSKEHSTDERGMRCVMVRLADQNLIIKMVGPAGEIAAQRAHFLAFCRSLSVEIKPRIDTNRHQ